LRRSAALCSGLGNESETCDIAATKVAAKHLCYKYTQKNKRETSVADKERAACDLRHLSDDELVAAVNRLAKRRRVLTCELVAHIAEMDERKLYREHACSSMFVYVTDRLHLSEASAYKHINVGRMARGFPVVFEMLAAGETHLSNMVLLAPHINEDNHRELLPLVRHKSKRQVERLLAERFPKAPVPARIRKLPAAAAKPKQQEPDSTAQTVTPAPSPAPAAAPVSLKPGKVKPLAPARFKVEFTADQELHDNIEKAKELLGPSLPRGELSELFALAMRNLVEELEKKKYAKTPRARRAPDQADPSASRPAPANGSRHIPNHVKREVVARDGGQCTFVDDNGNRCRERWGLEFHHRETPFARGGPPTVRNICLHCRPHNQLMAERDFGADIIAAKIAAAKAKNSAA
jgi:hypothetical protein